MNSILALMSEEEKIILYWERNKVLGFFPFFTLNDKTMQKHCFHFNTGNMLLKQ